MLRRSSSPATVPVLVVLLLSVACVSPGRGRDRTEGLPPSSAAIPAEPLPPEGTDAPTCPAMPPAYVAALTAAKYPSPQKISRDLLPILRSTPGLRWDADGRVLMVTWAKKEYFEKYQPGQPFGLFGVSWLTAVPQARDFCTAFHEQHPGEPLAPRIYQALGMPVGASEGQVFVELWLPPTHLFRPCPDPEVTDHECQVEIPLVGVPAPQPTDEDGPTPPWPCPQPPEPAPRQVSGGWVQVTQAHLAWMCTWWKDSYGHDEPGCNFPWTALGYTYDWGDPADPVGLSEYVAAGGTPAVFHRLWTPEEYCAGGATLR